MPPTNTYQIQWELVTTHHRQVVVVGPPLNLVNLEDDSSIQESVTPDQIAKERAIINACDSQ
jgi:hypothetical protein